MCGRCSSLPFALLLITNSNYTARQTDRLTDKGGTAVWLVLAKGQPAENRCRTVSQSQNLPQSKGNRRARLATDRQPTVCRPSFAAHFITMPLYSNPIIKRKTLGKWEKGRQWRQDSMFAARFHFRTW